MRPTRTELCLREKASSLALSLDHEPSGPNRTRLEGMLRELMSVAMGDPLYQDDVWCWEFLLFARWPEKAPVAALLRPVTARPALMEALREHGGDLPELAVLSLEDWSGREPELVRSGAGWAARLPVTDRESQRLCSLAHRDFAHECSRGRLLVMRRPLQRPCFVPR